MLRLTKSVTNERRHVILTAIRLQDDNDAAADDDAAVGRCRRLWELPGFLELL